MTPLTRRAHLAFTLVPLLLTASLAGCIGNLDDSDDSGDDLDPANVESFRAFLAAVGDGPATAHVAGIQVDMNTSGETVPLTVHQDRVDLGELSTSSQAALVASGAPPNGTAASTTITLDWLDVGDTNLSDVEIEIPTSFPVGDGIDATVTLDLDATRETGNATFDNLVVERGENRLKAVTRSQLDAPDRVEVPELPTPSIVATTAANTTAPSFRVNEDINFTYELPETNATVRNVFWAFGDDSTATGEFVQHAYRTPGFYRVTLIVEGERGQQATAHTTLEASFATAGDGNVLAGTTGEGAVDTRDVKEHTIEIPGNFTSLTLRLTESPSAGFCSENTTVPEANETLPTGGECLPSSVHVEIESPDGEILGRNTTDADTKFINVSGLMTGGEWTLRVEGDMGVAMGYSYDLEAHYLGLCPEAGGPESLDGDAGIACPDAPEPLGEDEGTLPSP